MEFISLSRWKVLLHLSLLKFNLSIIGVAKYATPILIVNLTKK